jgi:DNA ligase-associated metallophosphoesterase
MTAGLSIRIGDVVAVCRPSGALWVESARALIVADLHFEKASAYAARGQMLPPYDTRETLSRLEAETRATEPSLLVFLGDSFHDACAEDRLPPNEARRIGALAAGRRLVWIVGNHDEEGPRHLPGESLPSFDLAGLRLVHEPRPGAAPGEIAGHLHPCAKVRGPGGTVRRRCFVTDGERLVLPAFGALAGGLNIRDEAFRPLFSRRPLAGVLGRGRVHPVAWASLSDD